LDRKDEIYLYKRAIANKLSKVESFSLDTNRESTLAKRELHSSVTIYGTELRKEVDVKEQTKSLANENLTLKSRLSVVKK
jgi:hypothetical protein